MCVTGWVPSEANIGARIQVLVLYLDDNPRGYHQRTRGVKQGWQGSQKRVWKQTRHSWEPLQLNSPGNSESMECILLSVTPPEKLGNWGLYPFAPIEVFPQDDILLQNIYILCWQEEWAQATRKGS